MKLVLNTTKLKEMVDKATKCASNNKLIPLTSLMLIKLESHVLTLTTTDGTNYLYVFENDIDGDDFYVVVEIDTFSKLITRMTSETTTLEVINDTLVVTGNGKYSIELPLEADGTLIKYPNPASVDSGTLALEYPYTIKLATLKTALNTCGAALSTSSDVPCYTNYFVGNEVIATDTYKICSLDVSLLDGSPMLMSTEMMKLFEVMSDEDVYATRDGNKLYFKSSNCLIYGTTPNGIEDYNVKAIDTLVNDDFPSMCKLSKTEFLDLLNRLVLFVGTYDKNSIYLTFTKDGLVVSSKQSSGSEVIKYQDTQEFAEFTCCIDIEMLRSQIKAQSGDIVELWYGKDNAIKMVDDDITQIIALKSE